MVMKTRHASSIGTGNTGDGKSRLVRKLFWMGWLSVLIAVQPLTPAQASPPTPAGFRQDRVLVKPRPGADLTVLHAGLGVTVLRSFPGIGNLQIVQLPMPGNERSTVT